ncbi:MAG: hypothetical protein HYR89_05015 [Actinobacteria bacterium]|nr:hypothetical protein [Actinomycetota bacterium]
MRPNLLVRDDGPGGPLLVIVGDDDDFSRYLVEILRAEGLNCFAVIPLAQLSAERLQAHEVVLLGRMSLSPRDVDLLTDWVERGGRLLAMRPDHALAPLLGMEPVGRTLDEGYLRVDTTRSPGSAITDRVMQFHGTADGHRVVDASVVAELFIDADSPAGWPAVVTRVVGEAGGRAAAFTYDLARSVVQTRQGNPAWVGQNRDGDLLNRSDDLFYGAAEGDVQRDWVDPGLLDVPQADEQQRLMANVLAHLCADRTTLPRFWYLPERHVAAIVMTGDDHALNGTTERFRDYQALDDAVADRGDWGRVRATSYVYAHSPMTDAEALALEQQGFEISLHLTTKGTEYDLGSLSRTYRKQLKLFRGRYPSLHPPSTHRTHCVVWSDWSTQAEVERANGIRLDTNYYFYPAPWVAGRIGLFTGSGLPMRFASLRGEIIDCYQAATQLNDETGQVYPETIEVALDQALHDVGRATVLTANMHTDLGASSGSDAIVAEARRRGVPVISARQLLTWLDGRSASSFGPVERDGHALRFAVTASDDVPGLTALVPLPPGCTDVRSVTCEGAVIPFEIEELWGVIHVVFPARSGRHEILCSEEPNTTEVGEQRHVVAGKPALVDLHLGAGSHDGTALSSVRGGALVLSPGILLDPAAGAGFAGWHAVAGGLPVTDDGRTVEVVEVVEAVLRSSTTITVGSSFEAEVRFSGSPGQYLGLVGEVDPETSITFLVDDRGCLSAVNAVGGSRLVTPVPGSRYGEPHRFRVDWDAGLTLFAVDGRTIAEHRIPLREPLRPVIGAPRGSGALGVSWIRTSDFPLSGTFTSRVIDLGASSTWGHTTLRSPALTMTGARAAFRAGDVELPDPSWSDWIRPGASGAPLGIRGRYLQYQVTLLTASPRWTPEVLGVSIERLS